jgi:pimeloyl-ACP methyl ester carboxylesterase
MPPKKNTRPAPQQPPATLEVVNPLWLLKAIGITIAAAIVCGYLSLCLLFYQGQWQLILHPSRTSQPLTSLPGLTAEPVHFDAAESGQPRLSGLWIPAPAMTRYPALTVLYLRSGDTSLAQSSVDISSLSLMHELGLSIFAFDYRGYGQSEATRPNQARMTEDAEHALQYLRESRHLANTAIVPYGRGLGASLASHLASANPGFAGVILDSPGSPPLTVALADPRVRALPVRLLFHEDFSLSALATLKTPKLLISYPNAITPVPVDFRNAADPRTIVELQREDAGARSSCISRFLDQFAR